MHLVVDALHHTEGFDQLDPATLEQVVESGRVTTYEQAAVVYSEGQPAEDMFVLISGAVTLFVGAEEVIADPRRAPAIFGEAALWDQGPRMVTAIASEPSTVLAIPQAEVRRLVHVHPEIADALLGIVASVIRRMNAEMRAQQRVAPQPRHGRGSPVFTDASDVAAAESAVPTLRHFFQATYFDSGGSRAFAKVITVPRPLDVEAVTARLAGTAPQVDVQRDARALLELEDCVALSADQIPAALGAVLATERSTSGTLRMRLESGAQATHEPRVGHFVARLVTEPIVPIEASPLGAESLLKLVQGMGGEAALAVVAVLHDPVLVVSVPAAIVLVHASHGAGKGLGKRFERYCSGETSREDDPADE